MTNSLPASLRCGISFKGQHAQSILEQKPDVGWFEVHPENYLVPGGPRHSALEAIRNEYPLSLHGVSLSLGGADPVDMGQLKALKTLVERYQPMFVSDHLAWCQSGGNYFPDLLPLPLTEQVLLRVCDNISRTQDALGQQIFVENPSNYMAFAQTELEEPEFLRRVVQATGCKLLLDLNNIHVSAENLGFDASGYVDSVPADMIGEVHLAGHTIDTAAPEKILIDDHGSTVAAPVWALLTRLCERVGSVPVMVEWDTNVPELAVLVAEATKADAVRSSGCQTRC